MFVLSGLDSSLALVQGNSKLFEFLFRVGLIFMCAIDNAGLNIKMVLLKQIIQWPLGYLWKFTRFKFCPIDGPRYLHLKCKLLLGDKDSEIINIVPLFASVQLKLECYAYMFFQAC